MQKLNVLSLFNGMSCGQMALDNLGVEVNQYYSSEIDKYAIKLTQYLYPNTIQLGDITKWRDWNIDLKSIDLILAGSPCQGFSFAGKQLAFNDPRSRLFFVFVDILNQVRTFNPNVKFLLENVKMKGEHEAVITQYMGVAPIEINSSLLSAQNRVRLYWTNIANEPYGFFNDMRCTIPQPKNKGVLLRDVLESEVDEKYFLSEKAVDGIIKHKQEQKEKGSGFGAVIKKENEKMNALKIGGSGVDDLIVHNMMPRSSKNGNGGTGHLTRNDGKTYCLDTGNTNAVEITSRIRRLTPRECLRLQTVPKSVIDKILKSETSDTQIYKMAGNGWTIDVISYILKHEYDVVR